MYYSYSACSMSIVRASQSAAPHVLPNHSDKSDTGKVADKKSIEDKKSNEDKKSTEDKHVRPHIPQHKQEKRRKHNKATHVKKIINKPVHLVRNGNNFASCQLD